MAFNFRFPNKNCTGGNYCCTPMHVCNECDPSNGGRSSYTITVSGFSTSTSATFCTSSGLCDNSETPGSYKCDCPTLNGTYVLPWVSTCRWSASFGYPLASQNLWCCFLGSWNNAANSCWTNTLSLTLATTSTTFSWAIDFYPTPSSTGAGDFTNGWYIQANTGALPMSQFSCTTSPPFSITSTSGTDCTTGTFSFA